MPTPIRRADSASRFLATGCRLPVRVYSAAALTPLRVPSLCIRGTMAASSLGWPALAENRSALSGVPPAGRRLKIVSGARGPWAYALVGGLPMVYRSAMLPLALTSRLEPLKAIVGAAGVEPARGTWPPSVSRRRDRSA